MAKNIHEVEAEAIRADEAKIRRTEIAMNNATPVQRSRKYANVINHLIIARFNVNQRREALLRKMGVQ